MDTRVFQCENETCGLDGGGLDVRDALSTGLIYFRRGEPRALPWAGMK